jgi:hypothetical protein
MEVLDLNLFLSFKTYNETQELDSKTLDLLYSLFGNVDKNKKNKKQPKTGVNILKNQKIQNKKDSMINRVNLILNKLSESNIDMLIKEFVENINQVDEEGYEEIMKAFYLKIVSEINFIKIYLQFLKIIGFLYYKVQNYDLSYFYSIVETKFKSDYVGFPIDMEDPKFSFISELDGENKRINNMILIKLMIDNKFISEKLTEECDDIIINQTLYLPDIYHWYNSKNRELTNDEKNKIKAILKNNSPHGAILPREKVLLESLITKNNNNDNNKNTNKTIETKNYTQTDTLKIECENIIDEYLLIKSLDEVKYFIENRCTDAISKNKFCEQIIDKYFLSNKEEINDIVDLIKQLIKSQILFKSNLSRGLLMINNSWKDRMIDYNKPVERMKNLLTVLKSIGITKGLEFLLDLYNVE